LIVCLTPFERTALDREGTVKVFYMATLYWLHLVFSLLFTYEAINFVRARFNEALIAEKGIARCALSWIINYTMADHTSED
jgi:hypothetical protein